MTQEIQISDGTFVKVDDVDYERLMQWKWSANGNGYAVRNVRYAPKKYRKQYLHRELLGAVSGEIVDHINRDRLDNRRENLRICSASENARNAQGRPRKYSSYKGVSFDHNRKKWVAQISVNSKNIGLGGFESEELAAIAYNDAAMQYHGEFAYVNNMSEANV